MRERRLPADDFLNRVGYQIRVFLQLFPFFGELAETISHARHGVTGGVIAANNQQRQVADKLHWTVNQIPGILVTL